MIKTFFNNSTKLWVFLQSILRHVHSGGSSASNQNGLDFIQTSETKETELIGLWLTCLKDVRNWLYAAPLKH